ncbi:unnamed protein product [Oncorhynchus mykiss]|uniref:DDE Tnp4 domain-containing protein n=1 Tax=Oncorhynchus mykiss TaxID=8022 RepID=A0A060W9T6_ONCMY|nr:unnamed protein product [Oncorhynchus mykiss]
MNCDSHSIISLQNAVLERNAIINCQDSRVGSFNNETKVEEGGLDRTVGPGPALPKAQVCVGPEMVKVPKAGRGVPPSNSRALTVWRGIPKLLSSEPKPVRSPAPDGWSQDHPDGYQLPGVHQPSSTPGDLSPILGNRGLLQDHRIQLLSWMVHGGRHCPLSIWDCLDGEYMPVPKEEDGRANAAESLERWNFPNCLGSIDGKHVVIQAPPCLGSQFYNYKGTYSVVLLAVVDAIYCFRVVDVGAYGKGSDGALQDGTLDIPPPASLPGAEDLGPVPHVFVGDEAFPLRPNLMRPYAGRLLPLPKPVRIFNKRLSRARLVVECAFGILEARWRMYWRLLGLSPSNVDACVKATCVLHNYLRRSFQEPLQMAMGTPNGHLPDVTRAGANNAPRQALQLTTYFSSPAGEVPWQYAME